MSYSCSVTPIPYKNNKISRLSHLVFEIWPGTDKQKTWRPKQDSHTIRPYLHRACILTTIADLDGKLGQFGLQHRLLLVSGSSRLLGFGFGLTHATAASLVTSSHRVSTNLTKQISRRFPGDSGRDFKRNPGHVCVASACYVMYCIYYI